MLAVLAGLALMISGVVTNGGEFKNLMTFSGAMLMSLGGVVSAVAAGKTGKLIAVAIGFAGLCWLFEHYGEYVIIGGGLLFATWATWWTFFKKEGYDE